MLKRHLSTFAVLVAIAIWTRTACSSDDLAPNAYLFERFDTPDWTTRWIHPVESDKYTGRFVTEEIPGSSNSVLKVRQVVSWRYPCALDEGWCLVPCRCPSPTSSMASLHFSTSPWTPPKASWSSMKQPTPVDMVRERRDACMPLLPCDTNVVM